MDNSFSLSDIAALNSGNGFGGNSGLIYIILFALIFGWGGAGLGGGRYADSALNTYATASSQQDILFGQKFSNLDNKLDRLANGIADATYALNNAVTTEGRATQSAIAECCCSTKEQIAQVRYDMANFNASTNANVTAQTQKVLDALAQSKIETLQSQVNNLQSQLAMQQAMCGVPKINPYMYGIVPAYQGCNCNCGNA